MPEIDNATAVGAAIHGAVAAGIVEDYTQGAARFGARSDITYRPDSVAHRTYDTLYAQYAALAEDQTIMTAMRTMRRP